MSKTAVILDMCKSMDAYAATGNPDVLKAHVDSYTRSDGTVVQAHDDKRQAAVAPMSKRRINNITEKHGGKMIPKGDEWSTRSSAIPASDVSKVPEFSHKEVYGHDGKTNPGTRFSPVFAAKKHQGFVIKHPSGHRSFVDTEGTDYARYHAPVDHLNRIGNYEKSANSARKLSDHAYNYTQTARKTPLMAGKAIAAHEDAIESHGVAAKHASAAGESTYDHDKHIRQHKDHIEYLKGL